MRSAEMRARVSVSLSKARGIARMLCFVTLLVCAVSAQAQSLPATVATSAPTAVPPVVPYSGVAFSADERPTSGEASITFIVFKDESGGEPLWIETQTVAIDPTGHYKAQLGATNPNGLPSDLFSSGEARWLEVQVAGRTPQPRVLLASVPYALKAADAATLGGLPASAFMLASQAKAVGINTAQTEVSLTGTSTDGATSAHSPIFVAGSAVGIGTPASTATLHVSGNTVLTGLLTVNGNTIQNGSLELVPLGTATAAEGYNSQALKLEASAFNSSTKTVVTPRFEWKTIPSANNTDAPSATLELLTSTSAADATATGFFFNANGTLNFASGQAFPGAGSITGVTAGTALTGGGSTGNVTLNLDTTKVPLLGSANLFIGNQSITGSAVANDNSAAANSAGLTGNETAISGLVSGVSGNARSTTTGASGVSGRESAATGLVYGVLGTADSSTFDAAGVQGVENATTGQVYGVNGTSASSGTNSAGVGGYAMSKTGSVSGVSGYAVSTTNGAVGVGGYEGGATGQVFGVNGGTSSTGNGAAGVSGSDYAATGQVFGVVGNAYSSTNGASGVNGYEGASTGLVFGVTGIANTTTASASGINGYESAAVGAVFGVSGGTASTTAGAAGVNGYENATTGQVSGVFGATASTTAGAAGIVGQETAATGPVAGVYGGTRSDAGVGVSGNAGSATGQTYGVNGNANSTGTNSAGVYGLETAATGLVHGVQGTSVSTTSNAAGVSGFEGATTGVVYGVTGSTNSSTPGATGVNGYEGATTGVVYGVQGNTQSPAGAGVSGIASSSTGGTGVSGTMNATSGSGSGVFGSTNSPNGTGISGVNNSIPGAGIGVLGISAGTATGATGVKGSATNTTGSNYGVVGSSNSFDGYGVFGSSPYAAVSGWSQSCTGASCTVESGTAGDFETGVGGTILSGSQRTATTSTQTFSVASNGDGFFAGNLTVLGKLSKGSGSFKIDDPLDPAHKYLSHSFVESPDMMDVYNGNIFTDKRGVATVELPQYFEALNRDFRYQLTVIGEFAQAIVLKKVDKNHFTIRTSKPGVEVSWQVTGIRQDAYANANRIPNEEDKPANEQGYYLHPEVFDQPADKSVASANKPVALHSGGTK